MSKDLFDQILAAVEESQDEVPPLILSKLKTKSVEKLVRKFYNYDSIFKVMNSSIFHEGGLKGKTLPGEPPTFKVYPIKDLAYFIVQASILITQMNLDENFKSSITMFDDAIKKVDDLKVVAQFYRSWVTYKKLDRIVKEMQNIKSNLLSKPNPSKLHFRISKHDRQEPDRIDKLIQLFEEQISGAKPFMDRNLWKVENYPDFLAARRELLAKAANDFLGSLLAGVVPEAPVTTSILERVEAAIPGGVDGEEEERLLKEINEWVTQQGLPAGEHIYELSDQVTGVPLAVLDLAWPNGLQEGYSQPVALLIDEGREMEEIVNRAGYLYFTNLDTFKAYVLQEILSVPGRP